MPRARTGPAAEPTAYSHHSAERTNLPTPETSGSVASTPDLAETPLPDQSIEEQPSRTRYPRLEWNRTPVDEEERTHGPLYIHEKVSPETWVNSLLKWQPKQTDMFGQINGFEDAEGKPIEQAAWLPYQYKGHWSNRLIRSSAQRAMASLLYREDLRGQVNLIYMDPPYNISFRSNFQVGMDAEDQETGETIGGVPQDPVTIKAFRDNYRNGVHSYLDGLYDQFKLARELLADDGSIIVQIGPDNVHQVAVLMSEVFGVENHVATIPYITAFNQSATNLPEISNWLLWYAKDKNKVKTYRLYEEETLKEKMTNMSMLQRVQLTDGTNRQIREEERDNPDENLPEGAKVWNARPINSQHESETGRSETYYHHPGGRPCEGTGKEWLDHQCSNDCKRNNPGCPYGNICGTQCHANAYPCPSGRQWRVSLSGLHSIASQERLNTENLENLTWKQYTDDMTGRRINAIWTGTGRVQDKQYIVETPPRVLERCLLMTTDPGDLVLDLTCGSGAMPIQAETWGRRWIATDVSQVSIAIARERLLTTTYPCHLLKDSPEGAALDHRLEQELHPPENRTHFVAKPPTAYRHDPAQGFVNERQMRVSAATLAYGPNPDGSDVIRHPDRTKKDSKKIRVASPFTVESDSPYRATPTEDYDATAAATNTTSNAASVNGAQPAGSTASANQAASGPVRDRIIEALQTSGISQPLAGAANSRYRVENLQPTEHPDLTHTGTLVSPTGERLPATFYIAGEDEVVSAGRANFAAQQTLAAHTGAKHLIMIGFAQDENALPQSARHPALRILHIMAHRDLQLQGLKPGQEDDAFTIISEPEIVLSRVPSSGSAGEQVTLTVKAIHAYDPRKGTVSPQSAHKVRAVMVDTNYEGESFRARLMNVVRNKRNQKTLRDLEKALTKGGSKALDPDKWQAMQSRTTVPFDLPPAGQGSKIAVKVVDQVGTEHMLVLDPRDERYY